MLSFLALKVSSLVWLFLLTLLLTRRKEKKGIKNLSAYSTLFVLFLEAKKELYSKEIFLDVDVILLSLLKRR